MAYFSSPKFNTPGEVKAKPGLKTFMRKRKKEKEKKKKKKRKRKKEKEKKKKKKRKEKNRMAFFKSPPFLGHITMNEGREITKLTAKNEVSFPLLKSPSLTKI